MAGHSGKKARFLSRITILIITDFGEADPHPELAEGRFPFTRPGPVRGDLPENPKHTSFFRVCRSFPGASLKSVIIRIFL
ncbi:Uncharacterized protein dnm_095530 [Desulfonema magnum]|uniref:Uncharacterized protein n=1 Tax=Desulfonema magnum TaxID=45655 RepID=A0A975BXR6_9BACT|nr:Uncharacterized protein dnm_095530 [Desulfonema magnum]